MLRKRSGILVLLVLVLLMQACSRQQAADDGPVDILRSEVGQAEPELTVSIDEDNDSATLAATQNIDPQSAREMIQSTLWAERNGQVVTADFTLDMIDSNRAVLRFPNLPEGTMVQFKVEGVKTEDGAAFHIRSPQESNVITMRQGIAWSGLRWLDITGAVVHEHDFESGALIQPVRDMGSNHEVLIYNQDQTVYRLDVDSKEIEDVTIREWPDDKTKYFSEYGVGSLYSYPDGQEGLYVAYGLDKVYYVNAADGKKQLIYDSDRPIYGMASSPDGKHIALLLDSELNLGPDADLVVIDAKGKVVSEFPKAAYMAHSEGWHFIYPVKWTDKDTIAVPLLAFNASPPIAKGKAFIHYTDGLVSREEDGSLPEDAWALLQSEVDGLDPTQIVRILPKPDDEDERYVAVFLGAAGSYLIDREEKKVTSLGSGAAIAWTPSGQVVVWHSTEGKSVVYMGIE